MGFIGLSGVLQERRFKKSVSGEVVSTRAFQKHDNSAFETLSFETLLLKRPS
jgi:hypothetical protein